MPALLIDRPLAAAIADRRPLGPDWLVRPADETAIGCAGFARAFLLTPHFFPVSLDGETFSDSFRIYDPAKHSHLYGPEAASYIENRRSALVDAMPGDGAFVLGGSRNHFHWLADFLPRLSLLARAPHLPSASIIVHADIDPSQRAAIQSIAEALGLGSRVIQPVPDGLIGIRDAAVPTRVPRPAAVGFWRDLLDRMGIRPARPIRRLVVRRGAVARRRVRDEDALVARLAADGFEAVDPGQLPLVEQMRLFAEAAMVIGVHGAALANTLFMAPGTTVIELRHPDLTGEFMEIARAADLRWAAVPVEPVPDAGQPPLHRDVRLDPIGWASLDGLLRRAAAVA